MPVSSPLVSVLMPVYNAAPYVEQAIRSILEQTFTDFEFLIINDGSKDASQKVINSIRDERIIFVNHTQNKGLVSTLNEGLKLARGKYIARMDNDDISHPERFAKQVSFMELHPKVGLSGTAYSAFGDRPMVVNVPISDADIRDFMRLNSPMGHPTVMMRKSVIETYGLFYRQDATPAEDYRMWYDFSKVTQIQNLPEVLLEYRVHPQQMSSSMNLAQQAKADEVRVLQLFEKGFMLTAVEWETYCNIVRGSVQPRSANDLRQILAIMRKITAENNRLNAFDEEWFDLLFSKVWTDAVMSIRQFTPAHMPIIIQHPGRPSSSFGMLTTMRLVIKSLVYWKVRPVNYKTSPI